VPFSATAYTEEIGRMVHPLFRFAGAAHIFKKGSWCGEKKGIRGLFNIEESRNGAILISCIKISGFTLY
jgi:hypothetical protein